MGIYDREYYRREGPSYLGSFTERGHMCKCLIAANIIAFLIQLWAPPYPDPQRPWDSFTNLFILDAPQVLHGQVWRLVTYAFLHDTNVLQHILFNMLFLWWFGSEVEDLYGPREFLSIYLAAAFAGGVVYVLTCLAGLGSAPCLGASGAVTAIMVLCALHFPTRIVYLFFLIPIPIWAFAIFNVAQDAFIFVSQMKTGTAVAVHLAGAGFAYVYYKRHWRFQHWWTQLRNWQRQLFRPKLRVYREEPRQTAPVISMPPTADVDEQLEAKLDAVLEKVARFGRGSLTDSENQILMRASEIYKRRRT
jgi:membrane associated rhomboid family serine protease